MLLWHGKLFSLVLTAVLWLPVASVSAEESAGFLAAEAPRPAGQATEETGSDSAPAPREPQHPERFRPPRPQVEFAPSPIDTGYVFLEGVYLEAPYLVQLEGNQLLVNGRPLPGKFSSPPAAPESSPRPWPQEEPRRVAEEVRQTLASQGLLVAFADQPPVSLTALTSSAEQVDACMSILLKRTQPADPLAVIFSQIPEGLDSRQWRAWLENPQISAEGLRRMEEQLDFTQAAESKRRQTVDAQQRLDLLAYPVTLLGMVLCVYAIGHLLLHRPTDELTTGTANVPRKLNPVAVSLLLIMVQGGLDLFWTVLMFQTGEMKELNPIGGELISDPLSLLAFKGTATLVAVTLLFSLRNTPRGKLATWWICLTMTLVTVRWAAFNSMFIG